MAKRVRRPKDFEGLLTQLRVENEGPFESFKDTMIFAAALGYRKRRRSSFEKTSEPIAFEIFNGPGDEALIHMIALSESDGDISILGPERINDCIQIFEEYANGGLQIMHNLFQDTTRSPLEHIMQLIDEEAEEPTSERGADEEITKLADELM
jgi:dnd system-associated protein 4